MTPIYGQGFAAAPYVQVCSAQTSDLCTVFRDSTLCILFTIPPKCQAQSYRHPQMLVDLNYTSLSSSVVTIFKPLYNAPSSPVQVSERGTRLVHSRDTLGPPPPGALGGSFVGATGCSGNTSILAQ